MEEEQLVKVRKDIEIVEKSIERVEKEIERIQKYVTVYGKRGHFTQTKKIEFFMLIKS